MQCKWSPGPRLVYVSGCQPGTDRNTNPKAAARPISRVTARLPAHSSSVDTLIARTTSSFRLHFRGEGEDQRTHTTPQNYKSDIVMAKFACYSKENTENSELFSHDAVKSVMNKCK